MPRHTAGISRVQGSYKSCAFQVENALCYSGVGSLQVTRIQLALANASLVDLTNASYPHLFKAAQVRHSPCRTAPCFLFSEGNVELRFVKSPRPGLRARDHGPYKCRSPLSTVYVVKGVALNLHTPNYAVKHGEAEAHTPDQTNMGTVTRGTSAVAKLSYSYAPLHACEVTSQAMFTLLCLPVCLPRSRPLISSSHDPAKLGTDGVCSAPKG